MSERGGARPADDDAYVRAVGDLAALTDALLDDVRALDDDAVRAPSACPGWTRAHVLTHVARNADAFSNLLTWARTGERTPMYVSREQRDADIEAGAGRSAAELEADVEASAERLLADVAALPVDRRDAVVEVASGREVPARDVLWGRVREVTFHHVDLLTGYTFAHLPDAVVERALAEAAAQVGANGAPPLTLHATDHGGDVAVGAGGPVVSGTAADLLGWVSGRGDGADLASDQPLPDLPPWG